MNSVLEKNISSKKEMSDEKMICKFVPSFFQTIIFSKSIGLANPKRWQVLRNMAIILYCLFLAVYYSFTYFFKDSLLSVSMYNSAAPIIASILFWPFIVIYDCELFYRLYLELRPLLKNKKVCDEWYNQNAKCNFGFLCTKEKKALISVFANLLMSVITVAVFCFNLSNSPNVLSLLNYAILLFPFISSLAITYLSNKNKNANMILTVVDGGLTYYTYILQYSKEPVSYLLKPDLFFGNLLIVVLVAIVFFIAGSTISPMIGLLKAFYLEAFEEKIAYPMENIAQSLNRINRIKRYFFHLTGITLLAYFQLLGSVYFLGILNRNSLVTIILFVLGSLFPLIMYLAANVFFKKLFHKIYTLQVEHIDILISGEIVKDNIDSEKLQALVAVKEMYSEEFEIHTEINKEIFVAMLSPLFTTVVALIFPFAS